MTDAEMAALEAAAVAATPGPWEAEECGTRTSIFTTSAGRFDFVLDGGGFVVQQDQAFVLAAHPGAVLALIARVRAAEAERDADRASAQKWHAASVEIAEQRDAARAEVAAAVAAEREACAQVAAGYPASQCGNMAGNPEEAARDTADEIAAAIRARGAAR